MAISVKMEKRCIRNSLLVTETINGFLIKTIPSAVCSVVASALSAGATYHSWFVVVFAGWQRRHPSSFSSRVEQSCGNLLLAEKILQIDIKFFFRQLDGLFVCVKRSQTVACPTGTPIFADSQYHWKDRGLIGRAGLLTDPFRQFLHPIVS